MPCSCKKSKQSEASISLLYRSPSNISKSSFYLQTVGAPYKPYKEDPRAEQISDSGPVDIKDLNFDSTTKPVQLCFNCVRKHLGLAYMFLSQESLEQNLIGLGELGCAAMHLKLSFGDVAQKIQQLIVWTLRQNDFKAVLPWIELLMNQLSLDLPSSQISKELSGDLQDSAQKLLLCLTRVYSLLFVQLSYEEVNKGWATAQLAFQGFHLVSAFGNRQLYMQFRELWKIIQSMKPGDALYQEAQKRLMEAIKTAYTHYKESTPIISL